MAEQVQFLRLSSYLCEPAFQSSYAGGPLLDWFQFDNFFFLLEIPKLDTVLHRWSHDCQIEGKRINLFQLLATLLLATVWYLVSHLHLKDSRLNHHCRMYQSWPRTQTAKPQREKVAEGGRLQRKMVTNWSGWLKPIGAFRALTLVYSWWSRKKQTKALHKFKKLLWVSLMEIRHQFRPTWPNFSYQKLRYHF